MKHHRSCCGAGDQCKEAGGVAQCRADGEQRSTERRQRPSQTCPPGARQHSGITSSSAGSGH